MMTSTGAVTTEPPFDDDREDKDMDMVLSPQTSSKAAAGKEKGELDEERVGTAAPTKTT